MTTPEPAKLTPQQEALRKRRGQWIALSLFAFVILVFAITISRLGENAAQFSQEHTFNKSDAVRLIEDEPTSPVAEETPAKAEGATND